MTHQDNDQKFIGIWLDNKSKDCIYAQDHLRTILNPFRIFNNLNPCIHFIININNANIILITLDKFAEQILPVVHSCEQIHSIYILNSNKTIQKQWIKDYQKIKGFYSDIEEICQKIKEDINQTKIHPTGISFLSSSDIDSRDINRQDPSFMYSQLLKEIILNDNDEETEDETKIDMLNFCRKIYINDELTLNILNEFEKYFLPELSIYWYTRECFLYKMLNKALWTPQPDVLYKLRYFLRHLHQQILSQAKSQNMDRSSLIVYRGQNMSLDERKKLKINLGGFLSFNNFLSTSLKRDVGLRFVDESENGVLFEMFIDTKITKYPFANIEHLSFQQGENYSESELLFSMGTVFRIVGIDKENDFNRVQLMLSGDIDEQLDQYTKSTREDVRSPHCYLSLLKLMNELSLYNSIDSFAQMLEDVCLVIINSNLLDAIHNIFGLIYLDRGELKEALEHFHKSLTICLDTLSADHPTLAITYNNIGSVYSSQSEYEKALTFHKLALDCATNSENPNILSIIAYTNNIALIYHHQNNLNEALVYHKRALELQKEYLGENDPSLTKTYQAISAICYKLDDYEQTSSYNEKALALQEDVSRLDPTASANYLIRTGDFSFEQELYQDALNYFNRALQIQQQYFLPNNPSLALTYNRIALSYYKQHQFEQSVSNHIKALKIQQNSLSNDHSSIAMSYLSISKDYVGLLFWSDALEYGLKAIEQIKKSPENDIITLTSFINHIGYIYYQQKEYEQALIYYKEGLEQSLPYLSEDDASLAIIYYRIANAYQQLEIYNEALSFYQKTLNIELKTLPDNAETIATTYENIAMVYLYLKQFDNSFNTAEQALNQLLKTLPYNHPDVVEKRAALDMIKMIQIIKEEDD